MSEGHLGEDFRPTTPAFVAFCRCSRRHGCILRRRGCTRKPVDNDMHAIMLPASSAPADYYPIKAKSAKATISKGPRDLSDIPLDSGGSSQAGQGERAVPEPDPCAALGDVPPPRVGHATGVIGHRIFLFGGRSGPEAKPLDENGRVWVFDTRTHQWSYLDPAQPVSPGSPIADPKPHVPAPRSYHCAVTTDKPRDFSRGARSHPRPGQPGRGLAGLGAGHGDGGGRDPAGADRGEHRRQGPRCGLRMATALLYRPWWMPGGGSDRRCLGFDVHSRIWQKLPDAPGKPRGGAALAISNSRLYRFGGFNGEEEGDSWTSWSSVWIPSMMPQAQAR